MLLRSGTSLRANSGDGENSEQSKLDTGQVNQDFFKSFETRLQVDTGQMTEKDNSSNEPLLENEEDFVRRVCRTRSTWNLEEEEPKALKRRKQDTGGVHPLLVDHVIENVLEYMPDFIDAVKQFRLVCKPWCAISTRMFRSTYGRICFENDFNRKTTKFIEVFQNTQDMLFDKFKLSGGFVIYKPMKGHYGFDKIFNELFKVCVPWMTVLEFKSHNPSDLKFPKNIQKYDLTRLTSLSFHICVFYKNLQYQMTDYLGSIFDEAINLKYLDFRVVSSDPSLRSDQQVQLMESFGHIIGTKIPKTCKHLKLNMRLNESHLRLLEERRLNLEWLIIDFQKTRSLDVRVLASFLKSQSSTLKHLELIEAPKLQEMEFPILSTLSSLKIEGKPNLPEFKLETAFPKLKSIEILFYWIYQKDFWLKNVLLDAGHSKSTDVEFLCEINEADVFILYRIVKCFPCLKRLNVVLNTTSALSILFSTMPFLEDLEISLAREFWEYRGPTESLRMGKVDQAFCGIPAEHCIQLLKNNDFINTDVPETGEPSLRDLKNLTKLKLRAAPFRADQIPLTDVTVYYSLLKMKSLTHLILDVFPISKKCLRVLDERVQLVLLPGPPTLPS